jgi:hypothetical protein
VAMRTETGRFIAVPSTWGWALGGFAELLGVLTVQVQSMVA